MVSEADAKVLNTPKVLYTEAMSSILRSILAAGSARDWDKMSELAKDLLQLANDGKGGKFDADKGQ